MRLKTAEKQPDGFICCLMCHYDADKCFISADFHLNLIENGSKGTEEGFDPSAAAFHRIKESIYQP